MDDRLLAFPAAARAAVVRGEAVPEVTDTFRDIIRALPAAQLRDLVVAITMQMNNSDLDGESERVMTVVWNFLKETPLVQNGEAAFYVVSPTLLAAERQAYQDQQERKARQATYERRQQKLTWLREHPEQLDRIELNE